MGKETGPKPPTKQGCQALTRGTGSALLWLGASENAHTSQDRTPSACRPRWLLSSHGASVPIAQDTEPSLPRPAATSHPGCPWAPWPWPRPLTMAEQL